MTNRPPWRIPLALEYIRHIQGPVMDKGFCIMLGGGVLNRGKGPDLDLLAYPRTPDSKREDILELLPPGEWSTVEGVADIYSYLWEGRLVELIFQQKIT